MIIINKNRLRVIGAICSSLFLFGCVASAEQTNALTNAAIAGEFTGAVDTNAPAAATNTEADLASFDNDSEDGTNTVAQPLNILAAIPPSPPAGVHLSKPVEEVIKLSQSDVSESVIVLFVEKSSEKFNLSASDILYLKDIGISPEVMTAMLNHDGTVLPEETTAENASATNAPVSVPQQPAVAGQPVEISSNYVATAQPVQTIPTVTGDPNAAIGVVQQPVIIQQQPNVVYTSPAVSDSYFYSSLSPYGTWMNVPDYGWCWQPSIAISYQGWRPYLHGGRWLYSTSGWYWQSDYSWGWAPFHYGRWFCAPNRGWVWIPDYTWGPSWVTWRRGADYCGWAPLPPRTRFRPGIGFSYFNHDVGFSFSFGLSADHYCFVPTRNFVDRRLTEHVIPTGRSRNIYNNTTVINNYVVGNNNTIINNGIGRDYVASHTRTEIREVAIKNAPITPGHRIPSDRIDRRNDNLVVYRPTPPSREMAQRHESVVRTEVAARTQQSPPPGTVIRPGVGASRSPAVSERGPRVQERQSSSSSAVTARAEASRSQIAPQTQLPVWSKPAPVRVRPEMPAASITSRSSIPASRTINSGTSIPNTPTVSRALPTRPGIATSPRGASQLQADGYYQNPSVSRRLEPTVQNRETPAMNPRTITPAPSSRPVITPQSNVRQPTITPQPSVRQPTVTPPPSVRPPSVSPQPAVRQPTVTPQPAPRQSAPIQRQAPVAAPQRSRQESFQPSAQRLTQQSTQPRTYTPPAVSPTPARVPTRSSASFPAVSTLPGISPAASRPSYTAQTAATPAPRVQLPATAQTYTPPSFSAPSAPRVATPSVQSRSITPVQSAPRSAPSYQAPRVNIQSAPIRGGNLNSTPRSAPPARTVQPTQSRRDPRD